jgi:nitrate/nitrite transport system substrate-binding protein
VLGLKSAPDYAGVAKRVMRPDLYLEAMKEMGVAPKVAELSKVTLFDGTFDGVDPEKYARSFLVNSLA